MKKEQLFTFLDILRIVIVCLAFYFGYDIGYSNGYHPAAQLHFMIPVIAVAIAGLSGAEALFRPEFALHSSDSDRRI